MKWYSKLPKVEISLIADLVRDYGPESEMSILKRLNEVKGDGWFHKAGDLPSHLRAVIICGMNWIQLCEE